MNHLAMLAPIAPPYYDSCAAVNSAAGRENLTIPRRTSAHSTGAVFVSVVYGGCARDASERAGALGCRFLTPCTVTTQSREKDRGGSPIQGASPMASFPSCTLAARAAAHRAMAKSALFADSSAAVRLKRYNQHMAKARALEAQGVMA